MVSGLALLLVASRSEPIASFPGGEFTGQLAGEIPRDWSFLDEFEMIQLEVSPDAPPCKPDRSGCLDWG